MSGSQKFFLYLAFFAVLGTYLFASAPPPLQAESRERSIPIDIAFAILQQENAKVREIYTRDIVGEGKKRGMKFDEHWKDSSIDAGPLPAQFLREMAHYLEQSRSSLGLYLLSDFAINSANNVEGAQRELMQRVRQTRAPQSMQVEDTGQFAYMAPDIASVDACVSCHNKHSDSPKTDWQKGDVMGATTWAYPRDHVSIEELLGLIGHLHRSIATAYKTVLDELTQAPRPPSVGDKWPRDGNFLPTTDIFLQAFEAQTSGLTLRTIDGQLNPISIANKEGAMTP